MIAFIQFSLSYYITFYFWKKYAFILFILWQRGDHLHSGSMHLYINVWNKASWTLMILLKDYRKWNNRCEQEKKTARGSPHEPTCREENCLLIVKTPTPTTQRSLSLQNLLSLPTQCTWTSSHGQVFPAIPAEYIGTNHNSWKNRWVMAS